MQTKKVNTLLIIVAVIIAIILGYSALTNDSPNSKPSNKVEISPENDKGLVDVPDLELTGPKLAPNEADPISVRFLTEHRTALNGREVWVEGFITEAILGEDACPTTGGIGGCAQPRIFIADTKDKTRNTKLDLMILLQETDTTTYKVGEEIKINGIVSASKVAVVVDKIYIKL